MKRAEVWRADNGAIENDALRAKAHDLHHALPKSSADPNAKVLSWSDCMRIMENADLVVKHVEEFREHRDSKP